MTRLLLLFPAWYGVRIAEVVVPYAHEWGWVFLTHLSNPGVWRVIGGDLAPQGAAVLQLFSFLIAYRLGRGWGTMARLT